MLRGQSANCSCRVLDLSVGWKEEESVQTPQQLLVVTFLPSDF